MNGNVQRKVVEILRILSESDEAMGARTIADELRNRGYDIQERAVRYHLRMLDEFGFTEKQGYSGRKITKWGLSELEDALVEDRLGFVLGRIEGLMYLTTFDPYTKDGDVIVNVSTVDKGDFEKTMDIIGEVNKKEYALSPLIKIIEEGEHIGDLRISKDLIGIATVCSITIDGMLLKSGIPVEPKYSGIVEIKEGNATQFTDLIGYSGTSVDPIKIFVSKKMTLVGQAVRTGDGCVLANYRETPLAAKENVKKVINDAKKSRICGVINIMEDSALGIKTEPERIGIPIFVGVNGLVAAEEDGVNIETYPISALVKYKDMKEI